MHEVPEVPQHQQPAKRTGKRRGGVNQISEDTPWRMARGVPAGNVQRVVTERRERPLGRWRKPNRTYSMRVHPWADVILASGSVRTQLVIRELKADRESYSQRAIWGGGTHAEHGGKRAMKPRGWSAGGKSTFEYRELG